MKFIIITILLAIPTVAFLFYVTTFDLPLWVLAIIGWVFGWALAATVNELNK